MSFIFSVLTLQALLGATDNIWNHEWRLRLPSRRTARLEMALHAVRHFLYVIVFAGLAWFEWQGGWALVMAMVLGVEFIVTLADFLEEERTRAPLPALERALHTVLTLLYGVFLALFAPILWDWWLMPSALSEVSHGPFSYLFTLFAVGVGLWGIRDLSAAMHHGRAPAWLREPMYVPDEGPEDAKRATVLITGATGFIGRRLVRALVGRGYQVIAMTRDVAHGRDLFGPYAEVIRHWREVDDTRSISAVVNLAGAAIVGMPWFRWRRRELIASRVTTTRALVRWMAGRALRPEALISASAVGFYGARGDELMHEQSARSDEFQARLCRAWEAAAKRAETAGMRLVRLRLGVVLGRSGGAYPSLTALMRVKLGVYMGAGSQWAPWIHLDDAVGLIVHAIESKTITGVFNTVAPEQATHARLMNAFADANQARMLGHVPASLLRAALGEAATVFVEGQRVSAAKVTTCGYTFAYPTLASASVDLATPEDVSGTLDIFYNGTCPLCHHEMMRYRAMTRSDTTLHFRDVMLRPHLLRAYRLQFEHVESRLHVLTEDQRVLSGMDAVRAVWSRVPSFQCLVPLTRLPILRRVLDVGYDAFAAPLMTWWGRRHRRLNCGTRCNRA